MPVPFIDTTIQNNITYHNRIPPMRKNNVLIFFGIIIGCLLFVTVLIYRTGIKNLYFQTNGKRQIHAVNFTLNSYKKIDSSELYEIKSNGTDYFLRDGKSSCVYKFDKSLNLKKIRPVSSGAKANPDLRIERPFANRIAFFDHHNKQIVITDFNGNITSTKPADINRIAFLDTNNYFINLAKKPNVNDDILAYQLWDNNIIKPANLTPEIPNSILSYAGFFYEDKETTYYITYYYNNIYHLDKDGHVLAQGKTVEENIQLPEIKSAGGNFKIYGPKAVFLNSSATTDAINLYIISRYEKDGNHWIVDCYDKNTLKYKFSFLRPNELKNELGSGIYVANNVIYFSTLNKLFSFTIQKGML